MASLRNRKKNKGKERKAKKEAVRVEADRARVRHIWFSWATGDMPSEKQITCDHGFSLIPNNDHPALSFLDTFFGNWDKKMITCVILDTFELHPQVWNNDGHKKMAASILIIIGTNFVMTGGDSYVDASLTLARVIVLLEHYNGGGNLGTVINSRGVATKVRDLDLGSSRRRDALKFYSKRISCSCLKEMHQKARKSIPKMGKCQHCNQEKERVALSVCSRCIISQYCSRECQVASWPRHKPYCDRFVGAHQHQMSRMNKMSAKGTCNKLDL